MHIFVGSTNPVKVNSVVMAASEAWPEVLVRGVEVESGVSAQPRTDAETRLGALTRAKAALELGNELVHRDQLFSSHYSTEVSRHVHQAQEALGVGLEGGVFEVADELWSTVWAVVVDTAGTVYESNGARFKIPYTIAQHILAGEEMGPVMDKLLSARNTKQAGGAIGVITQNFVDRTEEYTGIVKLALGLWYGREWEKQLQK